MALKKVMYSLDVFPRVSKNIDNNRKKKFTISLRNRKTTATNYFYEPIKKSGGKSINFVNDAENLGGFQLAFMPDGQQIKK